MLIGGEVFVVVQVACGEGTELNGPTVLPPLVLTREGQSVGVAGCCSSIVELKRAFIKTTQICESKHI